MKNTMTFLALSFWLILAMYHYDAFSCSLKSSSSWYYSDQQLIDNTQTIFEGRIVKKSWTLSAPWGPKKYKYTIDVIRTLKGGLSKQTILTFNSDSGNVSYGIDCALNVSLEEGKSYLIFLDSFNPNGYKKIEGPDDPWISIVEKYINKPK